MLQVHNSDRFNDDGTVRRKYELEETGPGRVGLRVAFGLALGSVIALIKNVFALVPPKDQTPPEADPVDTTSQHRRSADEAQMIGQWHPDGTTEAADDNDVLAIHARGNASRPVGTMSQGAVERAAGRSGFDGYAGPSVEFGAIQSFTTASMLIELPNTTSSRLPAGDGGSGLDQEGNNEGDATPAVQPPPTQTSNRRPMSTGLVSLGAILLNAHVALALADLLSNSHDPESDRLTVQGLTASSGTLTLNEDGSWHYLPVYGDSRTVVFRYEISDGDLASWQEAVLDVIVPEMTFIDGTAGSDQLLGTVGLDSITAGADDDIVLAREGADVISGGRGADRIEAGDGDDVVWAGAGDDFVLGGRGDDALYGEDGDDSLHGEDGNDILDGGRGNDQLYGGDGNDQLSGGAGADLIDDGAGADVVDAGVGDDTIVASSGNDYIDGGDGNDTLVTDTTTAVQVDLAAGTASGVHIGHDRIGAIENVTTGSGDDVVIGDMASNAIATGAGNDTVDAGLSDDIVDLGDGDDVALLASDGAHDVVDAGASSDDLLVVEPSRVGPSLPASVMINLVEGTVNFGPGEQDIIRNFENVHVLGIDASVTGDSNANDIKTGAGCDTVNAGTGADNVETGDGDDTIRLTIDRADDRFNGGDGTDMIDLSDVTEDVTIDLRVGEVVFSDEIDTIEQFEDIRSGRGNDRLIADDEQNDFWGGRGNDAFIFVSASSAGNGEGQRDCIFDFEAGDRIEIDDLSDEFQLDDYGADDLRFTLLLGENRLFSRPGELRVDMAYEEFEGAPRRLVLDGNLDQDEDTEFQIELSGDPGAIMEFLHTAYGRSVTEHT